VTKRTKHDLSLLGVAVLVGFGVSVFCTFAFAMLSLALPGDDGGDMGISLI
jgi:hypothetical protein